MNPQRHQDVEKAFLAVLSAREDQAQSAIDTVQLVGLCGGDEEVHREVKSLLRHLDAAGDDSSSSDFLNPCELHGLSLTLGKDALLREWGGEAIGQRVDGFAIIGKLGAGGMGVVYVAEQENPRRTVALKIMRRSVATGSTLKRFEREAQLLGRLNHPGIAQIYAAGISSISGAGGELVRTPYIAMELVDGPTIMEYLNQHGRDPVLVLELMLQVCEAVQHAHQRGVIHRDLKPGNILVASHDPPADRQNGSTAAPQVKVLDFGVARAVGEALDRETMTMITADGHLIGTLAYMSPEQLESADDLDSRCDVYALGVILYQQLTGRLPIDIADCSLPEAVRRLGEREPAPLSSNERAFDGDLEIIVGKALAKDPARRYQSPRELGRDIQLYLSGDPIEARRDSLMYLMRRQAARYRNLTLGALLLIVGLIAFIIYARVQYYQQGLARADAEAAGWRAQESATRLEQELIAARIEQGRLLGQSGDVASAERFLWDQLLAQPDSVHAHWALWELYSRTGCVKTIAAHEGELRCLCADPRPRSGSDRVATAGSDGHVRFWSIPDGKKLLDIATDRRAIRALQFAPDGSWLAAGGDEGAALYDATTGARRRDLEIGKHAVNAMDVSSDGRWVATLDDAGDLRLWNAADGALASEIPRGSAKPNAHGTSVRFDPPGQRIAAGFDDGSAILWQLTVAPPSAGAGDGRILAAKQLHRFTNGLLTVASIGFTPDGACLICGGADQNLYFWDARSGGSIGTVATHNGPARTVSLSPDGKRIAVNGDFRIQLYDLPARQPWMPAGAGSGFGSQGGRGAAFSNDGRYLVSGGAGGTLRIWELTDHPAMTALPCGSDAPVRALAIAAPQRSALASVQADGNLVVREGESWRTLLSAQTERAGSIAICADAKTIAVGCASGRILLFDSNNSKPRQRLESHNGAVNDLRFSRDGMILISGGADHTIRLWQRRASPDSWQLVRTQTRAGEVTGLSLSDDGKLLVIAETPRTVSLLSVPDLSLLGQHTASSNVYKASISPGGQWIATGLWDRSIELVNLKSGSASIAAAPAMSLIGHAKLVTAQAFDPSGTLMASASLDGLVKLWEVGSSEPSPESATAAGPASARVALAPPSAPSDPRRCLLTLDAHAGEAYTAVFLPPPLGHQLAVGYRDGTVRIWDLRHYERHIAGQVDYQARLRGSASAVPMP